MYNKTAERIGISRKATVIIMEIRLGRYRHYKGREYEVIGAARHSETLETLVVYKALYGNGELWVRPIGMWNDEIIKDGNTLKRFEYMGK